MVDSLEDERVGLEVHVENCVGEGEVRACGGNDEFGEEHADGARQGYGGELLEALLFELHGAEDVVVVGGHAYICSVVS